MSSLDAVSAISASIAITTGLAMAFAGWSRLSIGHRVVWTMAQILGGFGMGYFGVFCPITAYGSSNTWIYLGIACAVGAGISLLIVVLPMLGPYIMVFFLGAILSPYFLLLNDLYSFGIFPQQQQTLARQEFVLFMAIISALVFSSKSKSTEIELHRFKYIFVTAILGGWLFTEGIFRFAFPAAASPGELMFGIIRKGSTISFTNGLTTLQQALTFVIWGGVALVGLIHQVTMRWGLLCYNRSEGKPAFGASPEILEELAPGAANPANYPSQGLRVVCENCFATVPNGTVFCTECGESIPTNENGEHDPNVSYSLSKPPTVSLNTDGVPERWQQVPHRAQLSGISFVDNSVSKKNLGNVGADSKSLRFQEKGVTYNDGSVVGYNDGTARVPNDSFRSFATSMYSLANRAMEPVETPNIRKYRMSGSGFFHIIYFMSAIAGVVWLCFLFTFYPREHPCSLQAPTLICDLLPTQTVDQGKCTYSTVNFDPVSGKGYCIMATPGGQWLCFVLFLFSEILNFFLGLLFNFSMWRPIRRGARYLNDFKPPLPRPQWPNVDVFLCHYMEPVTDSIKTLKNCFAMEYPPELLRVFVLDDGYCKSTWDANNHFKVTVNMGVIKICGDLRGEVAKFMHQKIVGGEIDDEGLKQWRRQHSSVRELRKEGGKGINRRDCAVGSISDDYDYRDRGFPRLTFVGRMKPEVHHSKAGNINNALFNEGADGKYLLILDNDMKPHPKFLMAVLPFFFSEGEAVDGGGRQYSDDISWNQVAYVQTPQYFEETKQLTELGDPCGHKNTIFFDAVQCGRDGYDSAAFAGTNAVFRRQAFDSIGGIQYGTQTEDAYTGNILHTTGWDSVYFRKDFEGEPKDRIRLCEGAIPETVAASMGQRKRWAKGAVQILLMKNESEVDPDWRPPRVPSPDPKPSLTLPRKLFYYDSVLYPFGSIPALCYITIAIYYLCTGNAPIYTNNLALMYTFLPLMLTRWMLNLLANRAVDNNDVWRAQQTWFSYSFITMLAIMEAIQARVTGKEKSWSNTGAGQKTSWTEIPNVMLYFTLIVSQFVALVRFFEYENATTPWNYISAMFFGFWIMSQLYPMVKMSLTEYCGADHTAATFTANVFGALILVLVIVFVQLWQSFYATNLAISQGLQ